MIFVRILNEKYKYGFLLIWFKFPPYRNKCKNMILLLLIIKLNFLRKLLHLFPLWLLQINYMNVMYHRKKIKQLKTSFIQTYSQEWAKKIVFKYKIRNIQKIVFKCEIENTLKTNIQIRNIKYKNVFKINNNKLYMYFKYCFLSIKYGQY